MKILELDATPKEGGYVAWVEVTYDKRKKEYVVAMYFNAPEHYGDDQTFTNKATAIRTAREWARDGRMTAAPGA